MSKITVNRIKTYLLKNFDGKINLEDVNKKTADDQQRYFYTRALSAYSLTIAAGANLDDAADSITDGFNDNGIDAIYFDRQSKSLWLVQSKFIESGVGAMDNGDIEKFAKGVKKLIDGDFERFNDKIKNKSDDVLEALDDASVKIHIVLAYTGKALSVHNKLSINDLLEDQNDTEEILFFTDFNIDIAYKALETGVGSTPISEDIFISNWGHIEEPFKSYYGLISGTDLGILWEKYGRRLFTENIRSFLGNSNINDGILNVIKEEPDFFIYFNNGITILCNTIKKKPMGGSDKTIGAFTCHGIAVVNGAQTLGSIGSLAASNPEQLSKIKVFVKFISLEESPEGFGQRVTVSTNTQNKVEKKDFVSLDGEQARIKLELKLENIDYHYKRTDEKVSSDVSNFLLEEVGFALASFWPNVDYSTMVKKESGKIWDDVTKPPYTDLFNGNISAQQIIKITRIYRYVSNKMNDMAFKAYSRERSIYRYGNSLVAHIIFQEMSSEIFSDSYQNFEMFFETELPKIAEKYIKKLYLTVERNYSDSMIVYVLRNYTKCRDLKRLLSN
ncbi:putative abortive infection phage resistance protein [Flavobacterium noncentrifugens]|uniref:AIPR protein n=1 Tax=Flavobacterium noncentrifugens TaxID=1128970 RepID=A0A1G8SH02_9FLAO|nr:AIPR family protein [Flavobacterium noncentrifugens]GEP49828.1 putative abortive infection phage resistance protein [Flavobacterium noncentrifugens]SDJ28487.1 AIPR protein [Flavobacterium noncentrifugens]